MTRAAALLLFVATMAAACTRYAPYQPSWNEPARPHRIVGHIYYVGTTELASFLITTPAGHILLDPSFDETVPIIRDSIRALGFEYKDVRVLLNSQAHYDHAAGLARVKRETGARVEAMGEDAALLERGGKDDFAFGNDLTFPPVRVDRVLRDGDTIELGGTTIVARHTPGHTKGATTFTTTAEEDGRVYQVVFATSTSVNPGTALIGNEKYPQIVSDWEKTYRVLHELRPDVWVSAHARFFDLANKSARAGAQPNPYVDPEGYRRFVESGEQRFRELLAAARNEAPGTAKRRSGRQ